VTTFEFDRERPIFVGERPIFVAADGRRARRLRYVGASAVLLGSLWLVALAVGMLGFGSLPDLPLPGVARGAEGGSLEPARSTVAPATPVSPDLAGSPSLSHAAGMIPPTRTALRVTRNSRKARAAAVTRARRRQPTAPAPASQPAVVTTPVAAPVHQGWARKDWTAPPGQSRQTEPRPPAPPPGQSRRQGGITEVVTPMLETAPLPPGQQKKPDEPKPNG
jgi:hypothetical protein